MFEDENVPDAGTIKDDNASAPLNNNISSEANDENQTETLDKDKFSKFDYLKELDSLSLDPAKKEILKAGYLRQADYTRKTMELAKERKTLDEYKEVQPVLEFLGENPDVFNKIVGEMQKAQPEITGQEEYPQDPKQYAEWVKANTIKEVMAIQSQEADFQKAAKIDPRLDSDPEFGETIAKLVSSDEQFRNRQITAEEATKKVINNFDRYITKITNMAKQNLSNLAKNKRLNSAISSYSGITKVGGEPKNIQEAAKLAEEELMSL